MTVGVAVGRDGSRLPDGTVVRRAERPAGQGAVLPAVPPRRRGAVGAARRSSRWAALQATNAVYRFFDLNETRGADWDSLYLQLQRLRTNDGHLEGVRNGIADLFTDAVVATDRGSTAGSR